MKKLTYNEQFMLEKVISNVIDCIERNKDLPTTDDMHYVDNGGFLYCSDKEDYDYLISAYKKLNN